jgi:hypothetical protein
MSSALGGTLDEYDRTTIVRTRSLAVSGSGISGYSTEGSWPSASANRIDLEATLRCQMRDVKTPKGSNRNTRLTPETGVDIAHVRWQAVRRPISDASSWPPLGVEGAIRRRPRRRERARSRGHCHARRLVGVGAGDRRARGQQQRQGQESAGCHRFSR